MTQWNDDSPIYLQLRALLLQQVLSGQLAEGEAAPSVRQIAAQEQINPLTVSKALQLLVDEGLLEKRRGLGMFVVTGAQAMALKQERARFLNEEWPRVKARIASLGLTPQDLFDLNADTTRNRWAPPTDTTEISE